ncbi:MAG: hypothetical protein JNM66_13115 [Bryobacterales bacterium]|nr:hypothetical protein [Bryobacterales bacterium]
MPTSLEELSRAEALNFAESSRLLRESTGLVSEIETLYELLPPQLRWPPSGVNSDESISMIAAAHELGFCRRQLSLGVLTLFRAYRGDSLTHLRRAIESCAFAVRMMKHHNLIQDWQNAAMGDSAYARYRRSFKAKDLFPDSAHADHDPILSELKDTYDLCSRLIHGSIFGLAGHFKHPQPENASFEVNFFDLPENGELINTYFLHLNAHKRMARLFEKSLKGYATGDFVAWEVRMNAVEASLAVHSNTWSKRLPAKT